jgi:subtilisin family serine protease
MGTDVTVATGRPGPFQVVFAVLVGLWTVGITFAVQGVVWAIEQLLVIEGLPLPGWGWPAASWGNAALVALPALVLAYAASRRGVVATGRLWIRAALLLGLLGSVRAVPPVHNELYLLLLTAVAGVTAWARRRRRPEPGGSGVVTGLAAGLAVLLPWLWVGALGGPLETVLAATAAFAVAVLVSDLLTRDGPWATLRGGDGPGRIVLAGLVGGVALLPVTAGVAGSGPHLALMLFGPALGFAGAALAAARGRRAVVALLAPAVFGPLAFVEPEETTPLLGFHDVGYWAAAGALLSLGAALLVGAVLLVGVGTVVARGRFGRRTAGAVLVGVVAAAAVVYPVAGHPGFFGERLFVVMKSQADLTGLAGIGDRDTRLRTTYRRLVDTANATQAPLRATLRKWHLAYTPYYLVNGIEVDGGPAVRAWLSGRDDVDRVLINPRLRPVPAVGAAEHGTRPAPAGVAWNISMIGADRVWAGGDTGAGIVIGASDSGVDIAHPALAGSFRGGTDSWYDPWNGAPAPVDHIGHGTHTLGSALGADGIGVAPGARWMACVNLDRNMANPAYYLDCLQFMLAPFAPGGDAFHGDPARAADVLTNSWACPMLEGCDLDALKPAVDALTAAGVFFVAAAGNEGPRCGSIDAAPAPYPATFTVAAVDRTGQVAPFSSRGAVGSGKPDVAAPGVDVLSALPGGGYGELSGTSMATPQVAGVVALMWSASPKLRGDVPRTAAILRATATAPAPGPGCGAAAQTGAGIVNAEAAVEAARAIH